MNNIDEQQKSNQNPPSNRSNIKSTRKEEEGGANLIL
jgi:hypothetical protein